MTIPGILDTPLAFGRGYVYSVRVFPAMSSKQADGRVAIDS